VGERPIIEFFCDDCPACSRVSLGPSYNHGGHGCVVIAEVWDPRCRVLAGPHADELTIIKVKDQFAESILLFHTIQSDIQSCDLTKQFAEGVAL